MCFLHNRTFLIWYLVNWTFYSPLYIGLIQTDLTFVSRECRGQFLGYVLATFHNRAIIEPECSQDKSPFSKTSKNFRKKYVYKFSFPYHFQCAAKTQLRSPDFSVRQKKIISNNWKMDIYCFFKNVQNQKVKGFLIKYLDDRLFRNFSMIFLLHNVERVPCRSENQQITIIYPYIM